MSKTKQNLEHWESRGALLAHRTKLYCAEHSIQPVVDFRPLARLCVLQCGCLRKIEVETDHDALGVAA
jgi:hypothetical protein